MEFTASPLPVDLPLRDPRYSIYAVRLQYHRNNLTPLCDYVIMITFIHVIVFSHLLVYVCYHAHSL